MARHAAEADPVEEGQPAPGLGLVGAQLALEALGAGERLGRGRRWRPARARRPSRSRRRWRARPARPPPGRRRGAGWRRPTARWCASRSASARAAASRSSWFELDPPALGPHHRAGLGGEPGDVAGVELDVVEQDRPAHLVDSWLAPTLLGPLDGSASSRRRGAGRRADATGTRTSNPAAASDGADAWSSAAQASSAPTARPSPGCDWAAAARAAGARAAGAGPRPAGALAPDAVASACSRGSGLALDAGGLDRQQPAAVLLGGVEADDAGRRRRRRAPGRPTASGRRPARWRGAGRR